MKITGTSDGVARRRNPNQPNGFFKTNDNFLEEKKYEEKNNDNASGVGYASFYRRLFRG